MTDRPAPSCFRVLAAIPLIAAGVPLMLWALLPMLLVLILWLIGVVSPAHATGRAITAPLLGIAVALAAGGQALTGLGLWLSVGRWRVTMPLGFGLGAIVTLGGHPLLRVLGGAA